MVDRLSGGEMGDRSFSGYIEAGANDDEGPVVDNDSRATFDLDASWDPETEPYTAEEMQALIAGMEGDEILALQQSSAEKEKPVEITRC